MIFIRASSKLGAISKAYCKIYIITHKILLKLMPIPQF